MSNVSSSMHVRVSAALALIVAMVGAGAGCSQGASGHARDASAKRSGRRLPAIGAHAANGDGDDADVAAARGADGVVSWSATLEEDAPVLAEFEKRAQAYGCATKHDGDGVLAKCGETPIMIVQKGRKVAVGCQRVTLEDCHALFEQIVSGGDEGGGEGGGDGDGGGRGQGGPQKAPDRPPPQGTTQI